MTNTFFGIPAQVDLGNLMVGVATSLVALVTLKIARKNVDQARKQKTADLINEWLNDLRVHLAALAAEVYAISVGHDVKDKERQSRILNEVFYIRLMLSSSSKLERLTEVMEDMQDAAIRQQDERFDELGHEYMALARNIVLDAWSDVQAALK